MNKNNILSLLATFATIGLSANTREKPNLVLFLADDCTYFDLGCYGSKDSRTPNIDKFASEGIRFTHAYQSAPMCSPTRHNLFTGLWPVKTGAYPNHTMAYDGTLSIVQHLHPAGYKVALIGKSHVQPKSVFPWDLYAPLTKSNDLNFAAADSFITQCTTAHEPFCLIITSNQPHTPWNKGNPEMFNPDQLTLPPYYVDIPETRKGLCRYLAEINYMDGEFGNLLKLLSNHNISNNSVVVYLSEQGNSLPFAKWTCYDAGVHSACAIRWPGKIQPHTTSDAMVEYVDILPTFLELANTKPLTPLDGKSFVKVLNGSTKEHKEYTFSIQTTRGIYSGSEYYGIRSVADKKYRYILNLTPEVTFRNTEVLAPLFQKWLKVADNDSAAREITHRFQHRPAIELYDLEKDRYCMHNIADLPKNKEIVQRMDKVLKEWMALCKDEGQGTELKALERQFKNPDGSIGEQN